LKAFLSNDKFSWAHSQSYMLTRASRLRYVHLSAPLKLFSTNLPWRYLVAITSTLRRC
jgi:hypothetical protein